MAFELKIKVEVTGDRNLFERTSKRLRDTRPLMRLIGEQGISRAQERLTQVLKPDAEVRTGNLAASLTIFDVTGTKVVIGSNLVYAAQVHFGGTILPKNAKSLAIPLITSLKRQQLGPLDVDPGRELLQFVPFTGSKPNVFGLLINPEQELTGRQRKKRGRMAGLPPGPLFALAFWVTQKARPFLFIDKEDREEIAAIYHDWLRAE